MKKPTAQTNLIIAPTTEWESIYIKWSQGVHPADLFEPSKDKKGAWQALSMKEVRSLREFASHLPVGQEKQVWIPAIDESRTEVQNALLKLLEEPPKQLQLFLLANSLRVLPTILSRCQLLELGGELQEGGSGESAWREGFIQAKERFAREGLEDQEALQQLQNKLYLSTLRHPQINPDRIFKP